MVPVRAIEGNVLTGRQVRVPVVLVACRTESGSAKCAFGHYLLPPRRLAILIGNTGYPDKIPGAGGIQSRFERVSAACAAPGRPEDGLRDTGAAGSQFPVRGARGATGGRP